MPNSISPIGQPIRGDFFGVSGTRIPDDADIVFSAGGTTITVRPAVRRPHFVFADALPNNLRLGLNSIQLRSASWRSNTVNTVVLAGAAKIRRALYTGRPERTYTIAFIANPAYAPAGGGAPIADPIMANRALYQATVAQCMQQLLAVTEDVLTRGDLDSKIRFVSVFHDNMPADPANTLAEELAPNIIMPVRNAIQPFLKRHDETADVAFVISDHPTHTRASAYATTDRSGSSISYTFDGDRRVHGKYARIPGTAALHIALNQLTTLHEFGHAASDYSNGHITDLYDDAGTGTTFTINKKFKAAAGDAVPDEFATYQRNSYLSDPSRDGLNYPADWTSYHPALIDAARPNLMDAYNSQRCRLDRLTYAWLRDRLSAKVNR